MNIFKNKRVLVTGGTGMVGRELVQLLLDRDAIVRVVSLDEPIDFFDNVEFRKKDLTNWHNCIDLCTGMDYVFHLAGVKSSAAMPSIKPLNYFVPMLRFNTNMMEAAHRRGVEWYLYTSSYGVYAPGEISHEDEVWKTFPSEHDKLPGWAKRMGELQAEGYKIQYGKENISIVRPANIYGKWDNFDLDSAMVIPSLISKAEQNKNGVLEVWGDGTPIRDFIYARDVAKGMIFAVENKITEPLNLGSGTGVSISQIAENIASYFNCEIKYDISKPSGDKKRILDMNRMFDKGFELSHSIKDGIKDTIDWYMNNKDKLNYRFDVFKD